MTNHALLNNIDHHDLKVIARFGPEFGDSVATVLTVPTEYADVQREYPIFFQQDPQSGEFRSIVLLGFEKNENLFLQNGTWDASYVPGMVVRGPFLIGFQEQDMGSSLGKEPVIHVDLDHPRVSRTEGMPVFLPRGGNSPYIEQVAAILNAIREGLDISKAMFAMFNEMELIEPVNLEVKLNDETGYKLEGLYTISRQKLANLDGNALLKLNRSGFLEGAFLVLSSLNNVQRLLAMKQRRLANQAPQAN